MATVRPLVSSLAALAFLLAAAPGWAATPTDTLRAFFERANAVLSTADDRTVDERRAAVRALVNEAVDFGEAAALALGRHWAARTPAEREEFARLFSDLWERGYVAVMGSKARLTDGMSVAYVAESVTDGLATVHTAVLTKIGAVLEVDYRMMLRDGRWTVRDVVIDGVSLAANYGAQFERVLQTGSYADLLERMRVQAGNSTPLAASAPPAPAPVTPRAAATSAPPPPAVTPPAPPELRKIPASIDAESPVVTQPPRPAEPRRVVSASATITYWVQIGVFRSVDATTRFVERLRGQAVTVLSEATAGESGPKTAWRARVVVGPFPVWAQAVSKLRELQALGHRGFIAEERE